MSKKSSHGSPRQTEVISRSPAGAKSAGSVGGYGPGKFAMTVTPHQKRNPGVGSTTKGPMGRVAADD